MTSVAGRHEFRRAVRRHPSPPTPLIWIPLLLSCLSMAIFQTGGFIGVVSGMGTDSIMTTTASVTVNTDRLLSEVDNNSVADIEPDKTTVKTWEDDDDDESVSIESSTVNLANNQTMAEIIVGGEKNESTSEWPDDDDDDNTVLQSTSNVNNDAIAAENNSSTISENVGITPEENASREENEKGIGEQVSSVEVKKETTDEWPDDDDDDESLQSSSNVNIDVVTDKTAKNTPEEELTQTAVEGGEKKSTSTEWPDDIDDAIESTSNGNNDANVVADTIDSKMSNESVEYSTGEGGLAANDDPENKADSATGTNGNEDTLILSGGDDGPSTAYHRNQSSEGVEAIAGEDLKDAVGAVEEASTEETPQVTGGVGAEGEGGEMSQVNAGIEVGAGNNGIVQDIPDATIVTGGDGNGDMAGSGNLATVAGNENSIPTDGNPNETNIDYQYAGEDEEGSFFEMVQATFNVLLLAACFTSLLVFRKRVMDRLHADSSLTTPTAMKEELVDVVMRLASWAANAATGAGGSGGGGAGGSNATAGNSRGGSYGPETIPLSTATDEEWGWEDEDMGGPDLELSGVGKREDEAKENDDLAMAIAMSLSETEREEAKGATASVPKSNFTPSTKTSNKKPPTRSSNNSSSTFNSSKDKGKIQRASASPKPRSASPTPPSSAAGGDSIEDLLGQMGGTGGPVITSFGQKPKSMSKPKPAPKKESSSDDIFASMGLSSFSSKPASSSRPAPPTSGGWQASTKTQPKMMVGAPKSAPSPSLLADTLDDDDADSWGDDGDLDDLLDD